MKSSFLILIILLSFSCQKQNKDSANKSVLKIEIKKSDIIQDEDFENFFERFNNDSIFQVSRVDFPIKVIELDTDNLKEDTLELNQTNYYFQEIAKESRDYNIEKSISKDSTKIILKGIDNGIYKEIFFFMDNGKWKLKTWSDLST